MCHQSFSFKKMYLNSIFQCTIALYILLFNSILCQSSNEIQNSATVASRVDADSLANVAKCQCDYYRLEGYYIWHNFTEYPNHTHRRIYLNPNGRMHYRCLVSIPKCHQPSSSSPSRGRASQLFLKPSGRNSRIPEVFISTSSANNNENQNYERQFGETRTLHNSLDDSNNCEDIQIAIEMPATSTGNGNITEAAYLEEDEPRVEGRNSPAKIEARDNYVAWLNISAFDHKLEGDYWFVARHKSDEQNYAICRHRLTLTMHRLKKVPTNTENQFNKPKNSTSTRMINNNNSNNNKSPPNKSKPWTFMSAVSGAFFFVACAVYFAFHRRPGHQSSRCSAAATATTATQKSREDANSSLSCSGITTETATDSPGNNVSSPKPSLLTANVCHPL